MLRLTGQLFEYTLSGNLVDYYDNTLRNHILTSSSHKNDGWYHLLHATWSWSAQRIFPFREQLLSRHRMESRFRYMENIFAYDEKAVYVNLLIDSILSDENGNALLELQSGDAEGLMEIRCHGDLDKELKIHIPAWGQNDFKVSVNGNVYTDTELHDGYLTIGKCKIRRCHPA